MKKLSEIKQYLESMIELWTGRLENLEGTELEDEKKLCLHYLECLNQVKRNIFK